MKILVFGLDGFCAWPMSLALAARGHTVIGVDNQSRRAIDVELGTMSLTPIFGYHERSAEARRFGFDVSSETLDVTNFGDVYRAIQKFEPDVIFHTAEIRAAPYSMISPEHKNRTLENNLRGTHNILNAVTSLKFQDRTHIVHIGTMGVYGYGGTSAVLPEGYAELTIHGEDLDGNPVEDRRKSLYPTDPGSVYHMTKSLDQILFAFYAKNDGLKITDLHQGIVWGTQTEATRLSEVLVNRFDYDEVYGTVLNRFLVQSAVNHPLTVYGTGGQTRGFININDAAQCVVWAVEDRDFADNKVRVINQVTEFKSVGGLADLVCERTGAVRTSYTNPRNEKPENTLSASNEYFKRKGMLNPILIEDNLVVEIDNVIKPNSDRVNTAHIPPKTLW